ncbi:hypothetical protein OA93_19915 [Flavobacterium sp. KMS]|nr:hypothetical protein OA93_19915 [Flavobacterium sp. KMS]
MFTIALQVSAVEIPKKVHSSKTFLSVAEKEIKGKILDENGMPIPGANIIGKGTKIKTQSDTDGSFVINVPENVTQLVISYIGMEEQEVTITKGSITIIMRQVGQKLDEVVVVGYGKQKKVNLSGAVSVVNTKNITNRPVTSLTNALQGTVPGLTITSASGDIGDDMGKISLRGKGNLGASEPLYVIDGVISSAGYFNRINSNDVESISVLKDASSSAIYGSRAAYGVILVTTKKGKAGKTQFNYNSYFGVQSAVQLPKRVNALQYAQLYNEARLNAGKSAFYTPVELDKIENNSDPDHYGNTDWYSLFLKKSAPIMEHEINVSGGGATRYYISGSIFEQNSLFPGRKINRYSFRSNIESKVSDKFTISSNTSYSRDGYKNDNGDVNFTVIDRLIPLTVDTQSDGTWGTFTGGRVALNYPYRIFKEGGRSDYHTDRFSSVLKGIYTPIKGLDITGSVSYSLYNDFNSSFVNRLPGLINFDTKQEIPGTAVIQNSYTEKWNTIGVFLTDLTVSYDKKIGGHSFKILGGMSYEDNSSRNLEITRKGYVTNNIGSIDAGSSDPLNTTAKGLPTQNAFQSFFGRFNYSYQNKYLLESSLRYDGSSKFPVENRFGVFPSVSGAWRISQEEFMKSVDWISELKLRTSWGKLGSVSNVGNYDYYDVLNSGTQIILDGVKQDGVTPGQIYNPSLGWEKVTMTNIGLDIGLWNNKLNIQLDAYNKLTDGILLPNPYIPTESGLSVVSEDGKLKEIPPINLGKVTNKGIELGLSYNNRLGGLSYSIGGNMSRIWNKVKDLGDVSETPPNSYYINRVGTPVGSFYMLEAEGLFANADEVAVHATQTTNTKAGDIKYKDQNGDGKIDGDDRVILGNEAPNFTYGLNSTLNYKNFDFGIIFQGAKGSKAYLEYEASQAFFNGAGVKEYALDRWTTENPNPNAAYPRMLLSADNTQNLQKSSFWLFDTSYLRVKSMSFGYNLPKEVLEKVGMQGLRFYLSGNNLFTIRGDKRMKDFDPETASQRASYPQLKTYSFGINASF